jgi:hypothetical protein
MTRPAVEALERAFACGRGLTPADARFVADDAYGLLARNLELEDALFLQQSLATEAVEVEVVPESDLPRIPDAQLFNFLHCVDGKLVLFDALERASEAPCEQVSIICAGFDQREYKLEIFVQPDLQRFSVTLDRIMFDRMPEFANPLEPDNIGEKYRNLVRHLVQTCPQALTNRAAQTLAQDDLTGDVTEAITYPRPTAYAEEQTWLLLRSRSTNLA